MSASPAAPDPSEGRPSPSEGRRDADRSGPGIALQLYTMRAVTLAPEELLERVAALGFDGVESVGTQGLAAAELRDALSRHGLRLVGAHVSMRELRRSIGRVLDSYAAAGAESIVIPWIDEVDRRSDEAGWAALGRELDAIGAAAAAVGLPLVYHHHDFELDGAAGATPLDALLGASREDHVGVELDVGWMSVVGHDPVAWLERLGGRCLRIHAKDVAREGAGAGDHPWADVGDGTVAWPALAAAAERIGVRWWIVEHDAPADPWATAERGLAALRRVVPQPGAAPGTR